MAIDGAAQTRSRLIVLAQALSGMDDDPAALVLPAQNVVLAEDDRVRGLYDFIWRLSLNNPWLILGEISLGYANTAYCQALLYVLLARGNDESLQQISEVLNQLRRAWLEGSFTAQMYAPSGVSWEPFKVVPMDHFLYTIPITLTLTVPA